jgi:hypothetical protein
MTPQERAKDLQLELAQSLLDSYDDIEKSAVIPLEPIVAALLAARNEGREEALEEAADIAERHGKEGIDPDFERNYRRGLEVSSNNIAYAIRQLKEKP